MMGIYVHHMRGRMVSWETYAGEGRPLLLARARVLNRGCSPSAALAALVQLHAGLDPNYPTIDPFLFELAPSWRFL